MYIYIYVCICIYIYSYILVPSIPISRKKNNDLDLLNLGQKLL